MIRLAVLAALIGALTVTGRPALAHSRDQVFSAWVVETDRVTASIRLPARMADPYESAAVGGPLSNHFIRTLYVTLGGGDCRPEPKSLTRPAPGGEIIVELAWTCRATDAAAGSLSLSVDSLFGRFPNHVHFARLRLPGGAMDEPIFTSGNRRIAVEWRADGAPEPSWAALTVNYVGLGVTHILGGADHLAFLLGLLLMVSRLRSVLIIVTGFTLGHCLTLGLAATGVLSPAGAVIEALIGFTVAIVAAEAACRASGQSLSATIATLALAGPAAVAALAGSALPAVTWAGLLLFTAAYAALMQRTQADRWAAALAIAFGLIHGFGFAGVLQDTGIPEGHVIPALFGFNLGVEFGQLAAVALILGLIAAGRRHLPPALQPRIARVLAAALCGLGTFWFVSRAFAG